MIWKNFSPTRLIILSPLYIDYLKTLMFHFFHFFSNISGTQEKESKKLVRYGKISKHFLTLIWFAMLCGKRMELDADP
jgi:hypothetical protein